MLQQLDTTPRKIADGAVWRLVYVQVRGAVDVRIARTNTELQNPGPGGEANGIIVTALDGLKTLWWKGEMWARSAAGIAIADFQEPG